MSPHEFSKQMNNPYFRTKYYKEESAAGKLETKVEAKLLLLNPLYWIRKVKVRREKKNQSNPID